MSIPKKLYNETIRYLMPADFIFFNYEIGAIENILSKVISTGNYDIGFMNGDIWSSIEGFEIDNKDHLYIRCDQKRVILKSVKLSVIEVDGFEILFLRGDMYKEKEIEKIKKNKNFHELDNTCIQHVNLSNKEEIFRCVTAPLFSSMLFPKTFEANSNQIKNLLHLANLNDLILRINNISKSLVKSENNDPEFYNEKGNTCRRIFEQTLKVECYIEGIKFNKPYDKLMLRDLQDLLKNISPENKNKQRIKFGQMLNSASHDGRVVTELVIQVESVFMLMYTCMLYSEVKFKDDMFFYKLKSNILKTAADS
ncbi:hypothetical protein QFZ77_007621 [Paenibacillus sp. V4I3]|uniref:hypothetical protein n=1 Tax=Paenibacillus sp. V4I3 TaxID=3042305 RepID=UPI0027858026|nr:hypothetical protein [Paenibacillus sp. V4I3]MDQ0878962.1 hypothetical protein [Paenibacillus sp. V4I3]